MRSRVFLGFLLPLLCGLSTGVGQETFVLVPKVPPADKPFKVALASEFVEASLRAEGSSIKYDWLVTNATSKAPFADDAGITNLVEGKISTILPILEIKTPRRATYRFEVRRNDATDDDPASVILVDATGDTAQLAVEAEPEDPTATATQPAGGAASPGTGNTDRASTGPPPTPNESQAAEKWPVPIDVEPGSSQEAIQERLGDARAWWNANVIKELKNPIVDEVFIRLKLTEDEKSEFNLKEQIQRPLIAAARFYRAAYRAAEAQPERAAAVWKTERERLLKEIEEDDQETELNLQLIRNFLEALEAEIKLKTSDDPKLFGKALLEAAMTIGKLLLKKVETDLTTLATGPSGDGRRSGEPTAFSGGDGYYGTSHAAVHHARAMARIRMRSARRMARIQSF